MNDLSTITMIKHSVKFIELLSAIVGTIYFYKYKHTYLKYFLYLLWYITVSEFFGYYIWNKKIITLLYVDGNGAMYNWWVYNLLYFIFFNVIFYIYHQSVTNTRYRICIKIFSVIYIVISAVNWLFIQNFGSEISVLPYIVGSFFLIIGILFYFIEVLQSDKIVQFHKLLLFWISVGLLLFHTGTLPFSIKTNNYIHKAYVHDLFYIYFVLAIVMYLIFTFGFIWSKKE